MSGYTWEGRSSSADQEIVYSPEESTRSVRQRRQLQCGSLAEGIPRYQDDSCYTSCMAPFLHHQPACQIPSRGCFPA